MGLNSHWGDSFVNWYLFGRFSIVNCCFYASKEDQQALYSVHHYDLIVKAKLDRDYRISNVISYIARGELCFFQIETSNSETSGGINQLKDAINNIILENSIPLQFNDATTFDSSCLNSNNNRQNVTKGSKSNSVVYLSFLRAILRFLSLKLIETHFLFESTSQSLSLEVFPFSSHLLVSNTFQKKAPTPTSFSILRLNPVISAKNEILVNINSTKLLFYKLKDVLTTEEELFSVYVIPSAMKYYLAAPTLKESIVEDEKIEGSETLFKVIKDLFNITVSESTKWIRLISPFNKKELLWPIDLCVIQFASDVKLNQQQELDFPVKDSQIGDVYASINEFINLKLEDGVSEIHNDDRNSIANIKSSTTDHISDEDINISKSEIIRNDNDNIDSGTNLATNDKNDAVEDDEWDDLFGSEDNSETQFIPDMNSNTNDDDLDQQLDELFNTESPTSNILPINNFPESEEPENFNESFAIPYKGAYSSPLYNDPGAPSPQEFQIFAPTPESSVATVNGNVAPVSGSIFSPLLFNPLIEKDIDSKYSNGGKFHFKQDSSLNSSDLFKLKNELNSDSSDSDIDVEGMQLSQFNDDETNEKSDEDINGEDEDELIQNDFNDEYTGDDDIIDIDDVDDVVNATNVAEVGIPSSGLDLIGLNNQYDLYQEEPISNSQILSQNIGIEDNFMDIQLPVNWSNILRPRMIFQGPFKLFVEKPTIKAKFLPILQELIGSYNSASPFREGSKLIDSDLEFLMNRLFKGIRKLTFKEVFGNNISGDSLYDCLFNPEEESFERLTELDSSSNIWEISHALKPTMFQAKLKDNKDSVFINETSLNFWKVLNLNPYHNKKDFVVVFLVPKFSDAYSQKAIQFKDELIEAYADLGLGNIKDCLLIELDVTNFWDNASKSIGGSDNDWSSIISGDNLLIMAINSEKNVSISSLIKFCEICATFNERFPSVSTFYNILDRETFYSVEIDRIVSLTWEYYTDLSLKLYNMCPSEHSLQDRKPPIYIGEENSIKLSLNQLESPIKNDLYLHVCYERSADKKWVVASWVNQHGDINFTKTWYTGNSNSFSQISDEMMEISLKYASNNSDSKTFMILTRLNNIFPDDELSEWKRLSMNRRVCLIVITVDPEPCTLLMTNNPGLNIISANYNQGASNRALSTPGTAILVSTNPNGFHISSLGNGPGSSVKFESPDLSMFTPSYDIVASPLDQVQPHNGTQIPLPSLPSVSEQVDVPVLIDIDQTSIGIILPTSQVLSNQNVRIPLKTGYLIKHGDMGLIENKCIEINLLSCYPTLGVDDILVNIMTQYKDLNILNRFWGIRGVGRTVGSVEFEKVWVDDDNEKLQYLQFRKQQQSQIHQQRNFNAKDEDTILPIHVLTVRKMIDVLIGLNFSEEPL